MAKGDNLKGKGLRFGSGQVTTNGGRPKGKSNKTKLKELIKDLVKLRRSSISETEKALAYSLYDLAIADYATGNLDVSVRHLYFINSDFGIKIGVSKDVNKRVKQIKEYASSAFLLKTISYGGKFEYKLHERFKHINIKGNKTIGTEWFLKTEQLLSYIDELESVNDLVAEFGSKSSKQLLLF